MQYDLIIVGGGLVGASFVAALKRTTLRIALIDARLPSNDDPRLFALNASSCQFLANLDCWAQLKEHASPIEQVHVSHQGHFGAVRLHHQDVNLAALGNVVPARYIESALNDALTTQANVTVYRPARLIALTQTDEAAEVTVEVDGNTLQLHSPVVIGADGTASTVRELANIAVNKVDYEQSAIVTRIGIKRSHQHIAYERFYQHGALAMLPLGTHECASILSAEQSEIKRLSALSDEDYLAEIQRIFGYRLGRLQSVAKRHTFPLQLLCAKSAHEKCVLLLGNAAHTVHPIAAQGFNLALYEAAVLAEGIQAKCQQQEKITAAELFAMLSHSKTQQKVSVKVSHYLAQLFSSQSTLASLLLSAGMTGFNLATPLKNKFINLMTGRSGRVPALLLAQME